MRKLVVAVALLAGLWLAGEAAVIPIAESRLEEEVERREHGAAGVEADIDSFPLVASVLVTGRAREVTITLREVAAQALTFTDIAFVLRGIEVDRPAILRGEADITDIESGEIVATLVAGPAAEALVDERLVGERIPLPSELFPCDARVNRDGDRIVASCAIDEIPAILFE